MVQREAESESALNVDAYRALNRINPTSSHRTIVLYILLALR